MDDKERLVLLRARLSTIDLLLEQIAEYGCGQAHSWAIQFRKDMLVAIAAIENAAPDPTIVKMNEMWCASFGPNEMDAVSGYGRTPDLALEEYRRQWHLMKVKKP